MNSPLVQIPTVDCLIFDMDGVLVNVSNSYRQAIRRTVTYFFTIGLKLGNDLSDDDGLLITNDDIDLLKQAGGFNNDWDVTKAFIHYFLELLPPQPVITLPLKREIPAVIAYLEAMGRTISQTLQELHNRKNIAQLARGLADMGGGIAGAKRLLKAHNQHLFPASGSLLKINIVERIFQELYLGETLFETIYETPTMIIHQPGLIDNESLIIDPIRLAQLADRLPLGIATGRPKAEADYCLSHFQIRDYFQAVVTDDDVLAAGKQGKPDPWSLLEAMRRLPVTPAQSAYVGDTPDDIRAAKAANQTAAFLAIGSLAAAAAKPTLRQYFESCQADFIFDHPNQLLDLLLS